MPKNRKNIGWENEGRKEFDDLQAKPEKREETVSFLFPRDARGSKLNTKKKKRKIAKENGKREHAVSYRSENSSSVRFYILFL